MLVEQEDRPIGATNSVAAVIVTYCPDVSRLHLLLSALAQQVERVFIVDNTPDSSWTSNVPLVQPAVLIRLGSNKGIAAAQNVGAKAAIDAGSPFIIFLDQDSIPAPHMVSRLLAATLHLQRAGKRVAAVGPSLLGHPGASTFIRFGKFRFRHASRNSIEELVECDLLISSGSLISTKTLKAVGDMDESLFIDKVDTEWCLRAKAIGFSLFGVCNATLDHALGQRNGRVWLLGWRSFSIHRPFRYYYIIRNSLLVRRLPYVPKGWRRADLYENLKGVLYFLVVSNQRGANLRMMLRGLHDGMRGVSGPLQQTEYRS